MSDQPGCPCCYEVPQHKSGLSAVTTGRLQVKSRVTTAHTELVEEEAIRRWRYPFVTVEVNVKQLPTGDEATITVQVHVHRVPLCAAQCLTAVVGAGPQNHWPMEYVVFLCVALAVHGACVAGVVVTWARRWRAVSYRSNVGASGTAGNLTLLLPTQKGTFVLPDWHRMATPTVAGVDWGALSLGDYNVNERDSVIGESSSFVCRCGTSQTAPERGLWHVLHVSVDRPAAHGPHPQATDTTHGGRLLPAKL